MFNIQDIWGKVKKFFTKREVFFIVLLVAAYFTTRLINLTKLPIFTDEGIYIHWAKVAWHDAAWRFISLTDGRQPLQTWATIPFLKLFPEDPLFAGRLFSVSTGFGTLLGLFITLYYLFGKKAAYIGSLIYILNPYFLFYDRMALADSSVNAGFIWMLLLSIILIRQLRLDVALVFGLMSGFVLLSKSTPKLFLITSATAPLLMSRLW
jgi:4-amino-4-deoxy-L-arabinose transferase-like glycosyltransferase